jgi:hypothetical protein
VQSDLKPRSATVPVPIAAVIAGAQKSGTTSLLRYMAQHPQLSGQTTVEIGYFFTEDEWAGGWQKAYARYFYDARTDLLLAKSAMLYARPICIERLASHNPECAVILVLRDPVERAFSSYRMERNGSWIDEPFDHILTVLDDRDHPWNRLFIQFGEYAPAIRRIAQSFPQSRVKVFIYEEFIADPARACGEAFRFLGVDDAFVPETATAHNVHRKVSSRGAAAVVRWLRRPENPVKRVAKRSLPPRVFDRVGAGALQAIRGRPLEEPIPPDVRDGLARYYLGLNRELESLLGRDLSHWTGMAQPAQ